METLNIKGMFQNKKWSHKLQNISLYMLLNKIKYKADLYGKNFIQVGRFFFIQPYYAIPVDINLKI